MPEELVLLRNSERAKWRRCRQAHQWSYVEHRSAPRTKGALLFGTDIHAALRGWYPPGVKRGVHPAKTFDKIFKANREAYSQWDEEDNKIDAYDLGMSMLEDYVDTYGTDDHIKIIQPEQVITIDVMDRQGNYICTWVGQVDAMYEDLLRSTRSVPAIGALEHKTAKSVKEELSVISGYGEQGLSYYWAMDLHAHHNGLLPPDVHITHVKFNWLKKCLADNRPRNAQGHALNKPTKPALIAACDVRQLEVPRGATMAMLTDLLADAGVHVELLGEPSARQSGPRFHRFDLIFRGNELQSINKRIRAEAWEMAQAKAGKLPIYKNPTKDCDWDCEFKEVCELHEMGQDWELMMDLEFSEWNPYEEHELELERAT